MHWKTLFIACLAAIAPFEAALAQSFEPSWRPAQLAPDRPREAVRGGRQVSLEQVVANLRREHGGRMVDADQYGDPPIYRIIWLTEDGRRLVIEVDARTGRILR